MIDPAEYATDPSGRRVRRRLDGGGLEVVGDALRPQELEALLGALDPEVFV